MIPELSIQKVSQQINPVTLTSSKEESSCIPVLISKTSVVLVASSTLNCEHEFVRAVADKVVECEE